jgi:type IV/VI secretion system ImpK/VasF family protein
MKTSWEKPDKLSTQEREILSAFEDLLAEVQKAERIGAITVPVAQAVQSDNSSEQVLISAGVGVDSASERDVSGGSVLFLQLRNLMLDALEIFGRRISQIFVGLESDANHSGSPLSEMGNQGRGNPSRSVQVTRDPFQRAVYAGVGFVDERMLAFNWSGRQEWLEQPLEAQFFGSRAAGQQLFNHIEELKEGANGDKSLAMLYLSILNLGFLGMHAVDTPQSKISAYRKMLFNFINGEPPDLELVGSQLAGSGQFVQSAGETRFMPYLRPWIIAGAVIVTTVVISGQVLWAIETAELNALIQQFAAQMGY